MVSYFSAILVALGQPKFTPLFIVCTAMFFHNHLLGPVNFSRLFFAAILWSRLKRFYLERNLTRKEQPALVNLVD